MVLEIKDKDLLKKISIIENISKKFSLFEIKLKKGSISQNAIKLFIDRGLIENELSLVIKKYPRFGEHEKVVSILHDRKVKCIDYTEDELWEHVDECLYIAIQKLKKVVEEELAILDTFCTDLSAYPVRVEG